MSPVVPRSRREHRELTRVLATVAASPVFLGLLPFVVAGAGRRLDRRFGLKLPAYGPLGRGLGAVLSAAGFGLGMWAISAQLGRGRGTPLPFVPTQTLLTDGPFRYSRNPMTLGAVLAYLGVAIAARTVAGIGLVAAFAGVLVAYLKLFEEAELAERFGDPYLAYRRTTPFIVPSGFLHARRAFAGPRSAATMPTSSKPISATW